VSAGGMPGHAGGSGDKRSRVAARPDAAGGAGGRLGRPIDAVLFDMDGTLTEPILDFVRMKQALGCPQETPILEWMLAQPGQEQARIEAQLIDFEIEAAHSAVAAEGATDTVAWLRRRGYHLGIITRNCMRAVAVTLERCKLQIDYLWTREDRPHKPSGQAVIGLCERMGVDADRAVVVGDYKFDLEAAREAGSAAVLLVHTDELPEWAGLADVVIRRLTELKDLLRPRDGCQQQGGGP
jgi:HAD superfamily hydrolase (TIGR01549 family)